MKKLDINLENCYGIGKLSHSFDFSKSNSYLIYAPNGTMKSSFAKTFNDISKNDKKTTPCDRIYQSRKTTYEVKIDGSNWKKRSN
jgi:DNA polymerase III gamma/tau subunit